jgi:hypothetical protein
VFAKSLSNHRPLTRCSGVRIALDLRNRLLCTEDQCCLRITLPIMASRSMNDDIPQFAKCSNPFPRFPTWVSFLTSMIQAFSRA